MPLRYTILTENDDKIRADEKQIDSEKFDEVLIVRICYLVQDEHHVITAKSMKSAEL
jgi:hypothetical protein